MIKPVQMVEEGRQILARRVRLLRAMRGWSQEQLAESSGLHRTCISAIERQKRNIGLNHIERLAEAFNVPVRELLRPFSEADIGRDAQAEGWKRRGLRANLET